MKTNDLKKGARIKLANGWLAIIEDNKKGNIRMATVDGLVREMGSVYSHNIVAVAVLDGWEEVEHTEEQIRLRQKVESTR